MASLVFEIVDEGTKLRALRTSLEDPRFVLSGIGALIVAQTDKAFDEERMGKVKWKTREETGMVPNWPAVLAHFSDKTTDPPRRNMSNVDTLTGTGHLRGSFAFRITNQDTVEAGTTVPYAAVLHEGGESRSARITKTVQNRLEAWITKTGGAAEELRWLLAPDLQGEQLPIQHPARPLVGIPPELVADIKTIYGDIVEAS